MKMQFEAALQRNRDQRESIYAEFENAFNSSSNYMLFMREIDSTGHYYSSSSNESLALYAHHMANAAFLYEWLIEGPMYRDLDTVLILCSDHGAQRYLGEMFLHGVHGEKDNGNEAFLAILSPLHRGREKHKFKHEWLDATSFSATLSQYLRDVNVPAYTVGSPVERFRGDPKSKLAAHRTHEA